MDREIFNLKEHNLNNGLRLVTVKKDTRLASINIGVKIGSIYERKSKKGLSHFVEHMLFKGTKSKDNEKLNEKLEQRAGSYNAYTDYHCTVYSITALNEELESSLEILSDMLQNSIFPKDEVERERGVILAEIRTGRDDIEDYSYNKTMKFAFKNSSIKIDTIGSIDNVKSFTREELVDFYNKYYVPNNTYITVVSPNEHDTVYNLVQKYFDKWQKRNFLREEVVIESNNPIKKISYKKDIEQSTIIYLYTFHNINKNEELALRILNYKLGESANSILFRKLREEMGLAYDVYSELDVTRCVKLLTIYTAVDEENVDKAMENINKAILDINERRIVLNEENISLMKKVLKTAVAQTLEDCAEIGSYILYQIIDKEDIYSFVEDINNMESIQSEDIYNICKKVLNNPTVHILLPKKDDI